MPGGRQSERRVPKLMGLIVAAGGLEPDSEIQQVGRAA